MSMVLKRCAFGLFLTIMSVSCNSEGDADAEKVEISQEPTSSHSEKKLPTPDTDSMIKSLEGEWKETEYPFRLAEFKNKTVKFTEEGVAEEPTFREYTISRDCPFDVNNIKNAGADDVFLVMTDKSTCEIIKVFNDTLILSGFNVSSNSDYQIIYKKAK